MVPYHSCHIYGSWRSIYVRGRYGGQTIKGCDHFLWRSRTLETPCKDFNLVIGEDLGRVKWLKIGVGKGFIFHVIIPAIYPIGEILFVKLNNLYIQHA